DLIRQGYDSQRAAEFHRLLGERLTGQAGIEEVAFVAPVPLSGGRYGNGVSVEGHDGYIPTSYATVSAHYFRVLGIPLGRGRGFELDVRPDSHQLVISESAARLFWPGGDPLGKTLHFGRDTAPYRVIGVVHDVHSTRLAQPDDAFVYLLATPDDYRRNMAL